MVIATVRGGFAVWVAVWAGGKLALTKTATDKETTE